MTLQSRSARVPARYHAATLFLASACLCVLGARTASAQVLQEVGQFDVGSQPRQAAVDVAHDRMYVANGGSDTISVVDTNTNAVVATFDARQIRGADSDPQALSLALNTATGKLYVSFWGSEHRTWVIDANTLQLLKIIDRYDGNYASLYPYMTVADPAHNRIYVAHDTGALDVIDGNSDTIITQINNGWGGPAGMAANPPRNKVYVVYQGGGLGELDGATLTETLIGGGGPGRAALDVGHQRLYVYDYNTAYMTTYDTTSDSVVGGFVLPGGNDIALSPNGSHIYAINYWSGGQVTALDIASNTLYQTFQLCSCGGGMTMGVNQKNGLIYAMTYWGHVQILQDTQLVLDTAPVAQDQQVNTAQDTAKAITLQASDADQGQTLTYSIVTPPQHGSLSGSAPNLAYQPAGGFLGTDSFQFKASDGQMDSNIATVTITTTAIGTAVSIPSNFNGTAIPAGRTIWFTAVFKASGVGSSPVTILVTQQTIVSQFFSVTVPDSQIVLDPSATTATTQFTNGMWVTRVPASGLSGNTLLAAVPLPVTSDLPGGINPVTWKANISSSQPGVSLNWQWAAAVYTSFPADNNQLGVKPVDDNQASQYKNSDHAGTPEAFKASVTGGARGGGGSNYTGSYSGTGTVKF